VVDRCKDISAVEHTPNLEGRRMIMLIAPKPAVMQKAIAIKKAQAQADVTAQIARKDTRSPAPDDLDEDEINADVDDSGDDSDNGADAVSTAS